MHIEAYHSQINNRKDEEKQHIKIAKYPQELQENSQEKQLFYLKKEEGNIHIPSTQAYSRKIRRFKMQVKAKTKRKRTNNKHVSH